jgi:hypothetical protein
MLNRTVALEGGVATTLHRRREVTIREGDLVLGRSNDPLSSPKDLICTSRIYGWHADLIWTPRLLKSPKATWLFSAGVKKETFKAHKRILAIRNQPINPADQEETKIRLSSINLVARLAMGAQYFFDDHFGLRTAIVWEHSPHLTPTAFMQSTNEGVGEARLKNSFGYAIGVIVRP